jgi:putative flippase GtrA
MNIVRCAAYLQRHAHRSMILSRALEVLRYLATGTLCVALNLLIILFLTEWVGLHYLVSLSVCFVTVTFVGFYLNRVWTFRKRAGGAPVDLARYVFVTLVQLPLSLGACSICVDLLRIPYPIAIVLVSVAFVPLTYVLHRSWSFGLRRAAQRS